MACPIGGDHVPVVDASPPAHRAPLGPPHVARTSSQKDGEIEAAGAFSAGLRTGRASLPPVLTDQASEKFVQVLREDDLLSVGETANNNK